MTQPDPNDAPKPSPLPEPDGELPDLRENLPQDPRWRLLVDVVVFQGKLFLDALRDLFLSPISILLAIVGIIARPDRPGELFYDLMRWGRRSDHFIGLFNAGLRPDERDQFTSVDDIVETVEKAVRDEHQRGEMSAEARSHLERTLHKLDEATGPDRIRLRWRLKRAAVIARREARKARDQLTSGGDGGPGEGS